MPVRISSFPGDESSRAATPDQAVPQSDMAVPDPGVLADALTTLFTRSDSSQWQDVARVRACPADWLS
jgi:hypothetical protein